MPPAAILKNADDESLTALLHHALVETRAAVGIELAKLGLKVPISINSTLKALQTLPTTPVFRDHVATTGSCETDLRCQRGGHRQAPASHQSPRPDISRRRHQTCDRQFQRQNTAPFDARRAADLGAQTQSEVRCPLSYPAHYADVCKALVHLAHDLQSVAVAIGVETSAQAQALQQIGCDVGQGFLYGHPLPLEQLIAMIKQRAAAQQFQNRGACILIAAAGSARSQACVRSLSADGCSTGSRSAQASGMHHCCGTAGLPWERSATSNRKPLLPRCAGAVRDQSRSGRKAAPERYETRTRHPRRDRVCRISRRHNHRRRLTYWDCRVSPRVDRAGRYSAGNRQ